MAGLKGIRTVVIGNDREFFSPIDRFVPPHLQTEFFESDLDEADMDIMWEGDNKLVIMPRVLDPSYIGDVVKLFGYKNFHIYVPQESSAGLCHDILEDQSVMSVLVETIRLNPGIQIIPFGNTPRFYQLLATLASMELHFTAPETPENRHLVFYFDTKVGCRELLWMAAEKNKLIRPSEGYIVDSIEAAVKKTWHFVDSGRGVVYKANEGGSGIGINVFPPAKLRFPQDVDSVLHQVATNPLYTSGDSFIVEEYIQPDFSHHGAFPSVDARILLDGKVVIEAVDAMVILHEENEVGFYGCVLGVGLFTQEQQQDLSSMTLTVGETLSKLGYRGWFDVDYILSVDGRFTPTEANIRSTSMRYMVELGKKLVGSDYLQQVAMRSNDKYIRSNLVGITYSQLKEVLSDLLYPIDSSSWGIVLTESFRSKFNRGKFGYCIFGRDQAHTKAIEEEMEVRLSKI